MNSSGQSLSNSQDSCRPVVERDDIDRLLRLRRMSQVKSCYPCRQRKVKCDQGQPCRTCQRRGHPNICAYGIDAPDPRRTRRMRTGSKCGQRTELTEERSLAGLRDPTQTVHKATDKSPEAGLANPANPQDYYDASNYQETTTQTLHQGRSSVLALLDQAVQDSPGEIRRKAGPVLGLFNTLEISPFAKPKTPQELWVALLKIVPQQQELLMFFPSNGSPIYPLSPIFADISSLEVELCNYAQALESGDLRNPDRVSSTWITRISLSKISLLLAVLATGAHYTGPQSPRKRLELCLDFVQRAFEALRLANFALHPNIDNIQSLLIIGNLLQDCGQSDGSWVLLGTTIRLAQALGLHTQTPTINPGGTRSARPRTIWDLLARQDCLLSITHGRPAMVSLGWLNDPAPPYYNSTSLSPADIMRAISRIALKIMNTDLHLDMNKCVQILSELDDCDSRAAPHLQNRGHCVSLQQHFEHLTIRLHMCFVASMICRPALTGSALLGEQTSLALLRTRAKQSLIGVSRAFLEFQTLSLIPMRTWSITHSVLCSTILLCAWEETRHDPESRTLQRRVVEAFSRAAQVDDETRTDAGHSAPGRDFWLSTGHVLALVALQKALRGSSFAPPSETSTEQPQIPMQDKDRPIVAASAVDQEDHTFNFTTMLEDGFFADLDEYPWDQTDLPPLEYLDIIMNTAAGKE